MRKENVLSLKSMRLSLFEIFLIQVTIYCALWLVDEFLASYMSLVIPGIALAILTIAGISEMIEPSRISRKYYWVMAITIVTPLLIGGGFLLLTGGQLLWLEGI